MGEQGQRVGEMNKMREAFELWSTDDNPEHWNQRRGFEAGYQAAIADVKAGGVTAWIAGNESPITGHTYRSLYFTKDNFRKDWVKTWQPLYKLLEDV